MTRLLTRFVAVKYNSVEYNGYDSKNTEVESGLGASTVSIQVR